MNLIHYLYSCSLFHVAPPPFTVYEFLHRYTVLIHLLLGIINIFKYVNYED